MQDQLSSKTTFAVATLGCKVNQADSEAISEQMSEAGYIQHDFSEIADVYIVNTCTVTHLGDRSSRQMISQARRSARTEACARATATARSVGSLTTPAAAGPVLLTYWNASRACLSQLAV